LPLFLVFFLSLTLISADAPHITTTLLNQDPDPVGQGQTVEVRFKIENDGAQTLEDIEVEILPNYPFALYSGDAIRKLGKLRAGQTGADAIIVDYKLRVDSAAVEGDNEIELVVRSGRVEVSYTQDEFMIDIGEYNIPELKVYLRETDIVQPNSKGSITVEIANVDKADVKFLQLSLLPSEDYKLLSSSNYVYLGDVDSDDTESEDFDIFVQNVKGGEVNIPVLLQYKDVEEAEYEQEFEIIFSVYEQDELSKYGLNQRNYTLIVIVILILLVIGYIYWKKRKKR
jgi:hypothetical protein